MAYQRKTRDVYRLFVDYGQGWEHELDEFSEIDVCEFSLSCGCNAEQGSGSSDQKCFFHIKSLLFIPNKFPGNRTGFPNILLI